VLHPAVWLAGLYKAEILKGGIRIKHRQVRCRVETKYRLKQGRRLVARRSRQFASKLVVTCVAILFSISVASIVTSQASVQSNVSLIVSNADHGTGTAYNTDNLNNSNTESASQSAEPIGVTIGKMVIPKESLTLKVSAANSYEEDSEIAMNGGQIAEMSLSYPKIENTDFDIEDKKLKIFSGDSTDQGSTATISEIADKKVETEESETLDELGEEPPEVNDYWNELQLAQADYQPFEWDEVSLPNTHKKARNLDIRSVSNVTVEELQSTLPEELWYLAEAAVLMEQRGAGNAIFFMSVMVTEVGWEISLSGSHNYFNWSTDGEYYYDFSSLEEFTEFSIEKFLDNWTDPDFYGMDYEVNRITPAIVNTKYALWDDGSVNTKWENLLCKIMVQISQGVEQARAELES
jgi:hypothetical protein